jgi:CO dehydrogenase/acetyl-CoA synthase beta subunit
MKSAATDIRQKLADWIRPDEEDIEEVDEFVYSDNDPIVQDAKKNMEEREADDKNYPPEID